MKKPRSAIAGIVSMRCPKCREGRMFPEGTLYSKRFMAMYKQCAYCGQSFMPEPGYYFGAMFVSYGLNAAYLIAVWVIMYFFMSEVSAWVMIGLIIGLIIGLLPVTFRLSRVLWIYIFIRYKGPADSGSSTIKS